MENCRAMTVQNDSRERVSFHRHSAVEGVEVRIFGDSAGTWSSYNSDFEFLAPSSWSGEVRHRGSTSLVEPGTVLCGRPGEVFAARKVWLPGSRASLSIEASSLGAYLDEHHAQPSELELLPRAQMSPQLNASLVRVFRAFRAECSALALQSALVEFFGRAVPEPLRGPAGVQAPIRPTSARVSPADSPRARAQGVAARPQTGRGGRGVRFLRSEPPDAPFSAPVRNYAG
jgi:hypothetical protein